MVFSLGHGLIVVFGYIAQSNRNIFVIAIDHRSTFKKTLKKSCISEGCTCIATTVNNNTRLLFVFFLTTMPFDVCQKWIRSGLQGRISTNRQNVQNKQRIFRLFKKIYLHVRQFQIIFVSHKRIHLLSMSTKRTDLCLTLRNLHRHHNSMFLSIVQYSDTGLDAMMPLLKHKQPNNLKE